MLIQDTQPYKLKERTKLKKNNNKKNRPMGGEG